MIHPKRDLAIATMLFLAGLAALLWALPAMTDDSQTLRIVAGIIGGLVALFAALMIANFLFALRLVRQMQRGHGLIARWTVPAAAIDAFLKDEAGRPWNHWTPKAGQPAEILIAPERILAGGRFYATPTAGMQAVRGLRWIEGAPPVIAFDTVTITARSGGDALGVDRGELRLPATDRAAADVVWRAYHDMLAGRTVVAPDRWSWRIRVGRWIMVLAALVGLAGWGTAAATGWNGNDPLSLAAVVAMTAGLLFLAAGAAIVAFAGWFRRVQQGR